VPAVRGIADLDFIVVYVAQSTFMTVFDTSQEMAGWTVTGYALASAAAMAPSGWAIDRFGGGRRE
jgi:MFS family permease